MACRSYHGSVARVGWCCVWSGCFIQSGLGAPHSTLRFYQALGLACIEAPEMASAGNIRLTKKKWVRHES